MLGYKLKDIEEMVEGLLNVHESLPAFIVSGG